MNRRALFRIVLGALGFKHFGPHEPILGKHYEYIVCDDLVHDCVYPSCLSRPAKGAKTLRELKAMDKAPNELCASGVHDYDQLDNLETSRCKRGCDLTKDVDETEEI